MENDCVSISMCATRMLITELSVWVCVLFDFDLATKDDKVVTASKGKANAEAFMVI